MKHSSSRKQNEMITGKYLQKPALSYSYRVFISYTEQFEILHKVSENRHKGWSKKKGDKQNTLIAG